MSRPVTVNTAAATWLADVQLTESSMHAGAYVPVYAPQPDGHGPPPAATAGEAAADHEGVRVVVIDMYADDDAD